MAVKDWSSTAGSNTGILSGLTLDGSVMTPPQVDNAFREMAAQIASQLGKTGFKGADVTSAAPDLSNATGWYVDITGTTTITAFGTVDAGQMFMLRFTGALTLTHNASSLILPGATNIKTADGAVAFMMSLGSGNWRCINYQSAVGFGPTVQIISTPGALTYTPSAGVRLAIFEAVGGGGGSGGVDGIGATQSGSTGGGASGFYGKTGALDVTGAANFSGSIGAAGTAGAAGNNAGGNGGNTTITVGATTYTWGGGGGSAGFTASADDSNTTLPGASGVGTNVEGGGEHGYIGFFSASNPVSTSGAGGSSPLGTGGYPVRRISAGSTAGNAGVGRGAGASGSVVIGVSSDIAGTAGTAGYMRIWEFY